MRDAHHIRCRAYATIFDLHLLDLEGATMDNIILLVALAFALIAGTAAVTIQSAPRKTLMFLTLGFALYAAPAAVLSPQAAAADPNCDDC